MLVKDGYDTSESKVFWEKITPKYVEDEIINKHNLRFIFIEILNLDIYEEERKNERLKELGYREVINNNLDFICFYNLDSTNSYKVGLYVYKKEDGSLDWICIRGSFLDLDRFYKYLLRKVETSIWCQNPRGMKGDLYEMIIREKDILYRYLHKAIVGEISSKYIRKVYYKNSLSTRIQKYFNKKIKEIEYKISNVI